MTIYAKLLEAQKAVNAVVKGGKNESQNYNFVRAVDVVKEGKKVLNDHGLSVYISIQSKSFEPTIIARGDKAPGVLFVVEGTMYLADEAGEKIAFDIAGAGSSYGDEKGLYKAITGAWKYGIRTVLQIPDEADDPEVETENDREVAKTAPTPKAAPKGPQPATMAQIGLLRARARDKGLEDDGLKGFVGAVTGKHSSKQLTNVDIDALLEALTKEDLVDMFAGAKEVVEA